MYTFLAILIPNKLLWNNNFVKQEMMDISGKEEVAKCFRASILA
jgi:hypothetical protein